VSLFFPSLNLSLHLLPLLPLSLSLPLPDLLPLLPQKRAVRPPFRPPLHLLAPPSPSFALSFPCALRPALFSDAF